MVYALNLLGALLNAMNGIVITGVLFIIIRKHGIVHKMFIFSAMVYTALQGFTSVSVFLNIYTGKYVLLAALLRVAFGTTGLMVTTWLSIRAADFIRALREAYDAEVRREDEWNDRRTETNMLVKSSELALEQASRSLHVVQQQRTNTPLQQAG